MAYEVELKFPLGDSTALLETLATLHATKGATQHQIDRYFNHPSRDFAQTDEALRIRTVDQSSCVTYKGPLVDAETKTRYEIELPVGNDSSAEASLADMLTRLGFVETRKVVKQRTYYHLEWNDREFEIAFDHVSALGEFLEIETIADESTQAAAREAILKLARLLKLENSQRKSYLRMLIENDAASAE